ncbi:DNA-directed RNA polymerase subunit omega [Anaerofustis stercorihominis]|uniref:DNA-directed RNA polymerase subunit omega n=2 Tax=Anaerofustis stercorihominis TaxID=214853 RepID=B1C5R9_9FIRM|nr:DNA-directed RNA polymerase subunit omega [Anaerofustis stercorihominis]EDS73633.1 DNA-directed RNA polymerase, omega subunit [Anaerofustis stercorihominis DSM 17244]MCQ4794703.1 DNA-directed RNA polymerase subunit omega [Anaerofustis stercorihominis]
MFTMINPPINELLEKVDNKYVLAMLVAKRSRELFDGDEPMVDEYFVNLITTAVEEVYEDRIGYYLIEEGDRKYKVHKSVDLNEMLNSSL